MELKCNPCLDLQSDRKAYYFNGDHEIFYQGQNVQDLTDVDYCEIVSFTKPSTLKLITKFDCSQGSKTCAITNFKGQNFKSISQTEKAANCPKIFSMFVGFKVLLNICKISKWIKARMKLLLRKKNPNEKSSSLIVSWNWYFIDAPDSKHMYE